jgi:hypothetical protein
MAYEKVGVAYPISEDEDRPFVASATPHEPEIILTGLAHPAADPSSRRLEHSETNDGVAFDLPAAARNISWNDPFYENNPDIIAAFDVNSKKLREIYVGRKLIAWFILIATILLGLILSFAIKGGAVCWVFFWSPIAVSIFVVGTVKKEIYMLERRHVAVARCGVYLDETDEPGSSHLARRTVLKFDSIVSCSVHETGWSRPHYNVVIVTSNPNTPINPDPNVVVPQPIHISYCQHNVTGLSNGQAFVDLVAAMMEWSKQASSNTGSCPVDSVPGTTSAEMV